MNLEQKTKNITRPVSSLVNQGTEYDRVCFKREILCHLFVMMLLWSTSYLPEKMGLIKGICRMLFMITVIRYVTTLFRQIFICAILLLWKKAWRKLGKRRFLEKIGKSPENLLDVILGRPNCLDRYGIRCTDFPKNPLINLIPCSRNIFLPELNRYFFELQYKAIIKPDQLVASRNKSPVE
jgi:hypothetical protein